MNRRAVVVVLAVAALAMSAQPAAAANVTVSEHMTFGTGSQGEPAPASLTNAEVSGSGASASVAFISDPPDQSHNIVDDEGDGSLDGFGRQLAGEDNNGIRYRTEYEIVPSFTGSPDELTVNIVNSDGTNPSPTVDIYIVNESADFTHREGTVVATQYEITTTSGTETIPLSDAPRLQAGETYAIEFITTNAQFDHRLLIGVDDSASSTKMTVEDDSESGFNEYGDITITDRVNTDGKYVGAPHVASDLSVGEVDLTLSNASATVKWQEDGDNDGNWNTVSTATYTTGGTKSQSLSGTTADKWRAVVEFSTSSPSTATAELDAERVLSDNDAPQGTNPDPNTSGTISSYDGDISLDVTDADFPTAQGDSVTVSAENTDSNTQIGSKTITSNQTVSLSYEPVGGQNNITWTLTDSAAASTTVDQGFDAPQQILIFNASDPDQLIEGQSNEIVVRFYGDDEQIIERTVTDGTVSLAGFPAAPENGYEVTVTPQNDDYEGRTVVIDSLFDQTNVYLLPTSAANSTVEFRLTDRTGRYPQPRFTVERPITKDYDGDGSNETRYKAAVSERFSAAQALTVTLEQNVRYRLRVRNDNGAERVLGSYTPRTQTDVVELTIAQVELAPGERDAGVATNADIVDNDQGRFVRVLYDDPDQSTTTLNLTLKRVGVSPNVTVTTDNATDLGRTIQTYNVSQYPENSTFAVLFEYTRGGSTLTTVVRVGELGDWDQGLSPLVSSLLAWVSLVGITGLVVIRTPRLAAIVAVVLAAGFSTLGFINVGPVPLGIAGATAVLFVVSRGVGQ